MKPSFHGTAGRHKEKHRRDERDKVSGLHIAKGRIGKHNRKTEESNDNDEEEGEKGFLKTT